MRARTSGVFFHRLAPRPGPADPPQLDIALEQLAASAGHRPHIESEQIRNLAMAPVAHLQRLEPRVEAPLLLVEQTEEQHDGGLELVGQHLRLGQPTAQVGCGRSCASRQQLLALHRGVPGAVQVLRAELLAAETTVAGQMAQRVLGGDVQRVVQLVDQVSRGGSLHPRFGGGQQGPADREPDLPERPQAPIIEVRHVIERVVAPSVGIAGAVGQLRELSKHRPLGAGAEGVHELRHRGDLLVAQQFHERLRGEGFGSHCGRIPPPRFVILPY